MKTKIFILFVFCLLIGLSLGNTPVQASEETNASIALTATPASSACAARATRQTATTGAVSVRTA